MPVHKYPYTISLMKGVRDLTYTSSLLAAYEHTAHLKGEIDEAIDHMKGAATEEHGLEDDVVGWSAKQENAGFRLNDHTREVDKKARLVVKDNTDLPLWQFLFGKYTPSQLRSLSLEKKADVIERWLEFLKTVDYPLLRELHAPIQATVVETHEVMEGHQEAKNKLRIFRTVGGKKEAIDVANGARISVAGKLHHLPYERPELGLTQPYERRFFKPRYPKRAKPKEELENLEKQVTDLNQRIDEIKAKDQAEASVVAKAEAAKVEELVAQKEQRVAELEAEIAKLKQQAS